MHNVGVIERNTLSLSSRKPSFMLPRKQFRRRIKLFRRRISPVPDEPRSYDIKAVTINKALQISKKSHDFGEIRTWAIGLKVQCSTSLIPYAVVRDWI